MSGSATWAEFRKYNIPDKSRSICVFFALNRYVYRSISSTSSVRAPVRLLNSKKSADRSRSLSPGRSLEKGAMTIITISILDSREVRPFLSQNVGGEQRDRESKHHFPFNLQVFLSQTGNFFRLRVVCCLVCCCGCALVWAKQGFHALW